MRWLQVHVSQLSSLDKITLVILDTISSIIPQAVDIVTHDPLPSHPGQSLTIQALFAPDLYELSIFRIGALLL